MYKISLLFDLFNSDFFSCISKVECLIEGYGYGCEICKPNHDDNGNQGDTKSQCHTRTEIMIESNAHQFLRPSSHFVQCGHDRFHMDESQKKKRLRQLISYKSCIYVKILVYMIQSFGRSEQKSRPKNLIDRRLPPLLYL